MNIAQTEQEILDAALLLFEEDSVDLCRERLKALDLSHVFPATCGMAMVAVRLSARSWREDIERGLARHFKDNPTRLAGVVWAFEALQEKP